MSYVRHKFRSSYEYEVQFIQKEFDNLFKYFYEDIYSYSNQIDFKSFSDMYCYYHGLLKDVFDCIQELALKRESSRSVWYHARKNMKMREEEVKNGNSNDVRRKNI